jgi:hypothetical protein
VPGCGAEVASSPDDAGEVHHIIERKEWSDGGYIEDNGASVCNKHHRLAEKNIIPPQAFWRWADVQDPPLPEGMEMNVDKWGEPLEEPPWKEHRDNIKYPSTRHLPFSHERDADDTAHDQVTQFVDIPLVITVKMDGGNAMLVKDHEEPIRARNGRQANKEHFDMAKQWYWENDLYSKIPEHLQVFGEWLYAKHSIHYGCDCDEPCEDVGPELRDYFQVFGMYDTRYDLWLGWQETERLATQMGLLLTPPSPIGYRPSKQFDNRGEAYNMLYEVSSRGTKALLSGLPFRSTTDRLTSVLASTSVPVTSRMERSTGQNGRRYRIDDVK